MQCVLSFSHKLLPALTKPLISALNLKMSRLLHTIPASACLSVTMQFLTTIIALAACTISTAAPTALVTSDLVPTAENAGIATFVGEINGTPFSMEGLATVSSTFLSYLSFTSDIKRRMFSRLSRPNTPAISLPSHLLLSALQLLLIGATRMALPACHLPAITSGNVRLRV